MVSAAPLYSAPVYRCSSWSQYEEYPRVYKGKLDFTNLNVILRADTDG